MPTKFKFTQSLSTTDKTVHIAVPGADEDAERISILIREKGEWFDEIIVTLDSHYKIHIAHGKFYESC